MSQASRRQRSNDGVRALATWLADEGWPAVIARLSGQNGADIVLASGDRMLTIEHKAADEWRLQSWLREARSRPGTPIVAYQGRGQGPGSVWEWPMIVRAADLLGRTGLVQERKD